MRDVLLVVHGVGEPAPGEIATLVASTLKRDVSVLVNPVLVCEFNWNSLVDQALKEGEVPWTTVERAAVQLAAASTNRGGAGAVPAGPRFLTAFERLSFAVAEVGLAVVFGAILLLVPVFMLAALTHSDEIAAFTKSLFPAWMKAAALAFAGGLSGILFGGMLTALVTRSAAPFFVALRRAMIIIIRPLLLVLVQLFVLPWKKMSEAAPGCGVLVLASSVLATVVFVVVETISSGWAQAWRDFEFGPLLSFAGFGVALAAFCMLMPLVLKKIIGPSLKILLDIFRYVGEPDYRRKIQHSLDGAITRLHAEGGPSRFFVVAHSLGSVIALHSLISSDAWHGDDDVVLITLGSPIRRCFMRFFPGLFFPATPDEAAEAVRARVGIFEWVNCYRPRDPVGTTIGFTRCAYASDVSSDQQTNIFTAHPNYWSDDTIYRTVVAAMKRTPSAPAVASRGASYDAVPVNEIDGHRSVIVRTTLRTILAMLALMPLVATVLVAIDGRRARADSPLPLLKYGVPSRASITYWRDNVFVDKDGLTSWDDNFQLVYRRADGKTQTTHMKRSTAGTFEPLTYVTNVAALIDHLDEHCGRLHRGPRCTLDGIEIRYDRAQPSRFILPAFPPKRTIWNEIWDWFIELLVLFVASIMMFAILMTIIRFFLSPLVGLGLEQPVSTPSDQPGVSMA